MMLLTIRLVSNGLAGIGAVNIELVDMVLPLIYE